MEAYWPIPTRPPTQDPWVLSTIYCPYSPSSYRHRVLEGGTMMEESESESSSAPMVWVRKEPLSTWLLRHWHQHCKVRKVHREIYHLLLKSCCLTGNEGMSQSAWGKRGDTSNTQHSPQWTNDNHKDSLVHPLAQERKIPFFHLSRCRPLGHH